MEMALGGKRTQIFRTLRYALISTWVCPLPYLHAQTLQQTRIAPQKVKEIPGVNSVEVELTFDPPYSQDMMSEVAKLELGFM